MISRRAVSPPFVITPPPTIRGSAMAVLSPSYRTQVPLIAIVPPLGLSSSHLSTPTAMRPSGSRAMKQPGGCRPPVANVTKPVSLQNVAACWSWRSPPSASAGCPGAAVSTRTARPVTRASRHVLTAAPFPSVAVVGVASCKPAAGASSIPLVLSCGASPIRRRNSLSHVAAERTSSPNTPGPEAADRAESQRRVRTHRGGC